jgi:hypothetical protein
MLALISLRNFAQSGHIDAFRSIVGEAKGATLSFRLNFLSLRWAGFKVPLRF